MVERGSRLPLSIGLAAFLATMLLGEYILRLVASRAEIAGENQALAEAFTIRATIEAEVKSTISLAHGLSAYLSQDPAIDPEKANKVLTALHRHGNHIRNIGLAPGNKLEYIYPVEGNESAIGLDYATLPTQWTDVKRAMDTRETVVAGPIALVQGGYGIVSRTPVFLEDGAYWGLVSIVIDVDSLLAAVGESMPLGAVSWALRADPGNPNVPTYQYGDSRLFSGEHVTSAIEVPGGEWEIAVERGDAGSARLVHPGFIRVLNLAVAGVIAFLLYMVLRERDHVHRMAVHDTLTGLPNRRLLFDLLEQYVALASRYNRPFCVIFLDLDGFKPINDEHGHHAGDLVLRETARRLRGGVRASDTVARIGGDEFVVVLPDTSELEGAAALAANLKRAIEAPVAFGGVTLSTGASLGIGRFPDHGRTPEDLLNMADAAMYKAKRSGRGDIVVLPALAPTSAPSAPAD